jgi:hypothetical protein
LRGRREHAGADPTRGRRGKSMAHLWIRSRPREWAILPLETDRVQLERLAPLAAGAGEPPVADDVEGGQTSGTSVLLRSPDGWILLAGAQGPRLNGLPVPLAIRVLRDRDELHAPGVGTLYFSTETLAEIVEYRAPASVPCARCTVPIADGDSAVTCPRCARWHHGGRCRDGATKNCWGFSDRCAFCPQETNLDAGFQWTPERM